jgi:hypothetical protein
LKLLKFPILLILFVIFNCSISIAQNQVNISFSNTTLAATDSVLPFWFTANQHGKIQEGNSFLNISELFIGQNYKNTNNQKLGYTWGSDFVAAFGENSYYQINQAFAGFSIKGWEIKGGTFYDEIRFAGLSTSNGNLAASGNARPVPKVRIATLGYKQLPFWKNWFSFQGEYEEGFLNDERYVDGAHLHHKSFNFKFQTSATFNFQFGFEHYAMWGGTSPDVNIGELPGWENYWRYVFALPGGEDFPETDQKNISGNQLGTYQLQAEKEYSEFYASVYISHPWEDNSGLNWHNWPDNLIGLHINFKNRKKLVTDIVYEFTNSRQQSIRDSTFSWDENTGNWKMNEYDSYYNHSIYRSGYTYKQRVMSSPLFFPVSISDKISTGLRSNRFFAHHIGLKGNYSDFLEWKGLLTYIQHFGTYSQPYEKIQKQISGLFEVQYINPDFPVQVGLSVAGDAGNYTGKNLGFLLNLTKKW